MAKRRRYTLEKKQEQISRAQIKAFLEPLEWIPVDIEPDLGEDLLIRIFEDGISTGLSFFIQLKSVSNIDINRLKNNVISYSIKISDLDHWEDQNPPVFLVIWDINQETGWWRSIDETIKFLNTDKPAWRIQKNTNIHIQPENKFDLNGLKKIRQFLALHYFPIVAKDKEFDIKAAFLFPRTPEGQTKFSEMQSHISTGDEVEIEGKYIVEFNFPNWWIRLFGEIDPEKLNIKLGPSKPTYMFSTHVDFILSGLDTQRIPNVELYRIKQGQDEITLSNEHQKIPYKLWLIINGRTGKHTVHFSIDFTNFDVITARQAVCIQKILSSGGKLKLTFIEAGVSKIIPVNTSAIQPPNDDLIGLVENLCIVQELTREIIYFPQDGSYTQSDIELAEQLVSVVKTGINRKLGETFSATLNKRGIQQIIKPHKRDEPIRFRKSALSSRAEILNSKIELGPFEQFVAGMWEKKLDDVLNWLEHAKPEDTMNVRLINSEIVVIFENWLKGEDKK